MEYTKECVLTIKYLEAKNNELQQKYNKLAHENRIYFQNYRENEIILKKIQHLARINNYEEIINLLQND